MKVLEYAVAFSMGNSLKSGLNELVESVGVFLEMGYIPTGSMTHSAIDDEGEGRYHYLCQPMVLYGDEEDKIKDENFGI